MRLLAKLKPEVLQAVKEAASDGRLTCTEARKLAETLGVSPAEIGQAADELKIKLTACELGCF